MLSRTARSPKVHRNVPIHDTPKIYSEQLAFAFLLMSNTRHIAQYFIAQALQLQVTGTGRTIMVDASPTMSAARLSRVIEKQTGVPQGSFALYHGSRPMCGTLEESGVTSGSTIELKFRGRGGGPEPPASSSAQVEIEPQPGRQTSSGDVETEGVRASALFDSDSTKELQKKYDRDGDGRITREEVRALAADFMKEKQMRRLASKAAIAMGVLILLVIGMNAGLTAAIVFLSKDIKVAGNNTLAKAGTDEGIMVGNTETTVNDVGELADRKHGTALKMAASEQELALDSRLPDSAWTELRHATFKSQEGGLLHVQVQVRCVPPAFPFKA